MKGFSAVTKTFFTNTDQLMSPRTANFVEAMIRDGDDFDYGEWLKGARGQRGKAERVSESPNQRYRPNRILHKSKIGRVNPIPEMDA